MKTPCRLLLFVFALTCYASFAQQAAQDDAPAVPQQRRGPGGRQFRGTVGEITTISGSTLKIKLADGSIGTVNTTSDTRFRKDQQDAKLSDFKVGDNVMIRGDSTGDKAWTAQMVASAPSQAQIEERFKESMGKTVVVGEVKALDPPKITVKRVDGVEQSIEADENTSFRRGRGENITLPDIKVGDTIMARGELKNGVFVPANVSIVDAQRVQRMRESGGMFMGGQGPRANGSRQGSNQQSSQQTSPQQTPKQ